MEPLVSVVVPVFNGMPHLKELTESVLNQTHRNLEVVFTEGGGSDSSIDFLNEQSDPRIRIVQMPKGTSAAENWTAASLEARGDYTKLICQDDLLYPDAIARQVADLMANPSAVMAIARRDIIDAHGRRLYSNRGLAGLKAGLQSGSGAIRTCYLRGTNVIGEPLAVLFPRRALQAALPWQDENPLMLDLSMYTHIAPTGDVVARLDSIGAFRVSASSWSTKLARRQVSQTLQWQEEYAQGASPPITSTERRRATLGRHTQTLLRRTAYAVLRAKGSLTSTEPSP